MSDTFNSAPETIKIGLLCDMPQAIDPLSFRVADLVAEDFSAVLRRIVVEETGTSGLVHRFDTSLR